ncbi:MULTISPECIES: YeeE/YedE family protein [Methylococcus]|uniref:YeeE/YedE thiosulfate transporter family protein n=1 Tax=Methylococcus capsulatus TaxID=414 RepID=A0ABZ2F7A3_METCP|nr:MULTISPECIES: YeeE/YedE thiosulfate transporter family protein [Methylococcus]MDF9392901.1 YeeE/YedE family protein [Methylococcus capsulatus]
MNTQTLLSAVGGGALIGTAACGLLYFNGRLAGVSTVLAGTLWPASEDRAWRCAFVLGLLAAGVLWLGVYPEAFDTAPRPLWVLAIGGFLVGLGAQLSNGCTSGHGVCGLGRRSLRSVVATLIFMSTGMATVFLFNRLSGG